MWVFYKNMMLPIGQFRKKWADTFILLEHHSYYSLSNVHAGWPCLWVAVLYKMGRYIHSHGTCAQGKLGCKLANCFFFYCTACQHPEAWPASTYRHLRGVSLIFQMWTFERISWFGGKGIGKYSIRYKIRVTPTKKIKIFVIQYYQN